MPLIGDVTVWCVAVQRDDHVDCSHSGPLTAGGRLSTLRHLQVNGMADKKSSPQQVPNPVLLSGGNPQIAKAEGDAPVQAYIAAMPGWKSDVGSRIDALIVRTVPGVHKAVKWNSPFYGFQGRGWFLSIHCFTKYIKVAFFRGMSLHPVPPVESRNKDTRYFHIHENDQMDEAQFVAWVEQASQLPGERM